jgi:hypothetical protein
VSQDPLGPDDHDDDQEEREEDHPVLGELAEALGQDDVEDGAEHRTGDGAEPADDDHDDDLERLDEGERVGVHVHEVVAEEPSGDAGHRRGDHEGDHLGAGRVDPHRLGRDFVLADRDERAPEGRPHDA